VADPLALAVEAVSRLHPFGLERIDTFEVRWTHSPRSTSAYVPFHRDDDVTMSVMVRLAA
jgi:hypothetical protein